MADIIDNYPVKSRTYTTRAGALKRLERVLKDVDALIFYTIGVTDGGRYFPLVHLREGQGHLGRALVLNGIRVWCND